MVGKRGRGRPRQKLLHWMRCKGCSRLKEEAQHGETWSHPRSGLARGHAENLKKKRRISAALRAVPKLYTLMLAVVHESGGEVGRRGGNCGIS